MPDRRWLEDAGLLHGCELVVAGGTLDDATFETLRPRELQIVPDGEERRRRMEVTARRMTGRAIGVVLSGGGAKAIAHIGVLEELRNAGVTIDRIGAVSLGAIVGAYAATGASPEELSETLRRYLVEDRIRDYTLPAYALMRGRRAKRALAEGFGAARIEGLPMRFFCLSCDIVAREEVVQRRGPIAEAVYASLAIPALVPPVQTPDGRLLVDGAVLDNLPVAIMKRSAEGPVIAVDVTGEIGGSRDSGRPGLARFERYARRALTGSAAPAPLLVETVLRTLTVGSIDTVAAARRHADLVISPSVGEIGVMEFDAFPHAVEAGRVAARQALADAPAELWP